LNNAIVLSIESPVTGKKADDKNNNGITKRFINNWKPWKSSILEAIAKPRPTAVKAIKTMNKIARNKFPDIEAPSRIEIMRIIHPCSIAIVAPPRVLPIIIESLLTGATRTSWRKPNFLSHKTETPANIEESIIAMATIPGVKKEM